MSLNVKHNDILYLYSLIFCGYIFFSKIFHVYTMNDSQSNLPVHVVIIPDGNRRWAKNHSLNPWEGHEEGAKNTEKIIERAHQIGVRCLSFWGSSVDNLKKRPFEEKRALLNIYEEYFQKLLMNKDIHANEARISIVGCWKEQFPESLKKILEKAIQETKQYSKNFLNFFLAYNGDEEMLTAIRSIIQQGISPDSITAETIKAHLYTKNLPPVDYLIRTGGEPHLSAGFMMWDTANAQLYFSDKFFPDFGGADFELAIREFSDRVRRMGR